MDPDPHRSDKLDLDLHQFADYNKYVWNMSLFKHLKVLSQDPDPDLDLDLHQS
jgi:hypothetical protein